MSAAALILTLLFGSPRAILASRVLEALERLCPCAGEVACVARHRRAAAAIAEVAVDEPDADGAAVLLLGTGLHETRFAVERQERGGPAVSFWQLEVPVAERAALLADPVLAARVALRAARGCGGSMIGYATGRCDTGGEAVARTAGGLRACVVEHRLRLSVGRGVEGRLRIGWPCRHHLAHRPLRARERRPLIPHGSSLGLQVGPGLDAHEGVVGQPVDSLVPRLRL